MDDWRTDLGPLATLIHPDIRDLCVDGRGHVWTDAGRGFTQADLSLAPEAVRRIGVALIDGAGGRVDDARPLGDAALAGRVRAHLVLPPVARDGPLLSLRFPATAGIGLGGFAVPPGTNIRDLTAETTLIAGVTGSGKTTLATALIDALPETHRVVIVEDLAEMSPRHPHTVHLTTRAANVDGAGAVILSDLVRESLRMRPDSLVVGEIRGSEIRDFIAAATAGHHGLATIHAGGLEDVATRVTALGLLAGIPRDAIPELVVSAIPRVVLCQRTAGGVAVTAGRFAIVNNKLVVDPT